MSEHWDDNFLDALRENLPDGETLVDLDEEASPSDLGLESINMISLMMRLDGDYDIGFPADAVSFAAFATPIALWNTVCELRVSEARPA